MTRPLRPSALRRFLAGPFLPIVWLALWPMIAALLGLQKAEITSESFTGWPSMVWSVLTLLLLIVVGFLIGIVLTGPLLGLLMWRLEEWNGGPFSPGDTVEVLRGRHRGRVGRVYSSWQRGTFRVELGQEAKDKFKDIFSGAEVVRVSARAENSVGGAS